MESWTIRLALIPATITSDLTSELMGQPTPQGAVKQPSEVPDRPTLAAAWALNLTTGPATKNQKGKPGKGSPRLEKIKKEKWKVERQRCGGVREANMLSCRGSGCLGFGVVSVLYFLAWLEGSRKAEGKGVDGGKKNPKSSVQQKEKWNYFWTKGKLIIRFNEFTRVWNPGLTDANLR